MTALTATPLRIDEPDTLPLVALDGATDTFPFSGNASWLVLQNNDASPITVTLLGDQASATTKLRGVTDFDATGGKDVTIAANSIHYVYLPAAAVFLPDSNKTPAINGAAATVSAALLVL